MRFILDIITMLLLMGAAGLIFFMSIEKNNVGLVFLGLFISFVIYRYNKILDYKD